MFAMPELPEVERVRVTLAKHVIGLVVSRVSVRRPDVVHGPRRRGCLLENQTISGVERLGKQLALVSSNISGEPGPCVCVHLGMSGSLRYLPPDSVDSLAPHTHVVWTLSSPRGENGGRIAFADARRFGGLWTFGSRENLVKSRWRRLGDDALSVSPAVLHRRLSATRRVVKAALLDQAVIAGLGNIYVDELLFRARIHPLAAANQLDSAHVQRMVRAMRALLREAVHNGGSSLRNYVDADGTSGRFQKLHQVYGRAGCSCVRCRSKLEAATVGGRATVWCPTCQPRRPAAAVTTKKD
jgi:formamidopyrimidine-DNA glycosylase